MTLPLRCGLVGIGMMGRNHQRVVQELPDAELVVIVDPQSETDGLVNGVPLVGSVVEALEFNIDFAIVAVPTNLHEAVSLELAQARVPTLIEKPLSDSVKSAEQIKQSFESTGTLAAVGHIERFNPAIIELKKKISAGWLGEVFQISTRRQSSFPGRISDVGVVADLASHDIDLVLGITDSTYETISAMTLHRSGRETEDMVVANARLNNGTLVNHVVNWLSPMKERLTVVTGEKGVFVADTLLGDLTLHRNGRFDLDWDSFSAFRGVSEGDVTRFAFSRIEPLKSELSGFVGAVQGNEEAEIVTLDKGVEVVRTIERILESSSTFN